MVGLASNDPNLPTSSSPSDLPRTSRRQSSSSYHGSSIYNQRSPYLAHKDEDLLAHTVKDSGLNAFGCIFAEVWVVSSNGRRITRPSGGHWMDPVFIQAASDPELAAEMNRVAPDCAPGESLAGTLLNEIGLSTLRWKIGRDVHWRQISSMMEDPFIQQGKDKRMEKLHDLGIGIVATVPFSFQDRNGIVLFMTRSGADIDKLTAEHNENYLIGATDLIGAAFAIRIPRMECSRIRREIFLNAIEKVRKKIREDAVGKPTFASIVRQAYENQKDGQKPMTSSNTDTPGQVMETEQPADKIPQSWKEASATEAYKKALIDQFKSWIKKWTKGLKNSVRKWKGAGLHAAPRQSLSESLIVLTGVFCVMLSLVNISVLFQRHCSSWWTFDPGWYSSSLCILFAMTAAPAGQPTQIVCAHIWCALVGYAFQQIPSNDLDHFFDYWQAPPEQRVGMGLPVAWKRAMSVAVGVSGQGYLGIMHPPATGLAFAFSNNPAWGPTTILMILLGDLIMVIMSMVILNVFQSKQYPMFWFGYDWTFGRRKSEDRWSRCKKWRQKMRADTDKEDSEVVQCKTQSFSIEYDNV